MDRREGSLHWGGARDRRTGPNWGTFLDGVARETNGTPASSTRARSPEFFKLPGFVAGEN